MKVIKAGYERVDDKRFSNPLQKIERIARICYKSEDKITSDSYKKMTKVLLDRQHLAMFEHASLTFEVDSQTYEAVGYLINDLMRFTGLPVAEGPVNNCRLKLTLTVVSGGDIRYIISGNIRAFYEFFLKAAEADVMLYDIKQLYVAVNQQVDYIFNIDGYDNTWERPHSVDLITDYSKLSDKERLIHETFTVIFTCDRGVTHELVRMRDASFAQESTRYCNYQLGRFGNEITVIKPCFFADENSVGYLKWKDACEYTEKMYFMLLDGGATPQEARSVLPTSVKADIALTTNLYEWRHIFNLRACDATGPAHPQMKEIMVPLFEEKCIEYPEIFGVLKKENA